MRSWRTASVSLLSFSSGLPLGLVLFAIPDWMRSIGVDIRVVGLITLAQAPWSFKVFWSPLMDRYVPPFWGRRRGWMAVTQIVLAVLALMLAGVGERPDAIWVVGALAFAIAIASASQDIAIDAYAVEVLRKDEQGAAVGARLAFYRAAMLVSGGVAITLALTRCGGSIGRLYAFDLIGAAAGCMLVVPLLEQTNISSAIFLAAAGAAIAAACFRRFATQFERSRETSAIGSRPRSPAPALSLALAGALAAVAIANSSDPPFIQVIYPKNPQVWRSASPALRAQVLGTGQADPVRELRRGR